MNHIVFYFPDSAKQGQALAAALGCAALAIDVHHFPDGESLVRVPPDISGTALVVRSLDRPNAKLVELMLACTALRNEGAQQIILIAPYLSYMRQDMAFHRGEAVSQKIIGQWLAGFCDALVTVDPHLHRVVNLEDVVPGRRALALSAAPLLGRFLTDDNPVLIGPDSESRQWVSQMAAPHGLDMIIAHKERKGDRDVVVHLPDHFPLAGRCAVIVDDVISSGQTLIACAAALHAAGVRHVEALATHCLASDADYQNLLDHGFTRVRASDSIEGPWMAISLAPLIADGLRRHGMIAI